MEGRELLRMMLPAGTRSRPTPSRSSAAARCAAGASRPRPRGPRAAAAASAVSRVQRGEVAGEGRRTVGPPFSCSSSRSSTSASPSATHRGCVAERGVAERVGELVRQHHPVRSLRRSARAQQDQRLRRPPARLGHRGRPCPARIAPAIGEEEDVHRARSPPAGPGAPTVRRAGTRAVQRGARRLQRSLGQQAEVAAAQLVPTDGARRPRRGRAREAARAPAAEQQPGEGGQAVSGAGGGRHGAEDIKVPGASLIPTRGLHREARPHGELATCQELTRIHDPLPLGLHALEDQRAAGAGHLQLRRATERISPGAPRPAAHPHPVHLEQLSLQAREAPRPGGEGPQSPLELRRQAGANPASRPPCG